MRPLSLAIGLFGAVTLPDMCGAQIFNDPFSDYVERSVTITPGAGNAANANAAIHTIDPWPPYVGNTRIPGDGRLAVCAVEQMYEHPFFPPFSLGASGGAAASGGGAAVSITTNNSASGAGPGAGQSGLCP
jgi:hypothetical protein